MTCTDNSPRSPLQLGMIVALVLTLAWVPAAGRTAPDVTIPAAAVIAKALAPVPPTPLTDSARVLASGSIAVRTPRRNSCVNRIVLGTVAGTGAGALLGFGLLVKSGGSDAAGSVLKGFAALGAVVGLFAGGISCTP